MATAASAGGASWTDLVSVLLAGVAFVISFASLWLTSLRRAKVEVDRLHDEGSLRPGGVESDGRPSGPHAAMHIFVANTGASGTVVTRLDATDFHEHNCGPQLWGGILRIDMTIGRPVALPLERDDAETVQVAVHLEWNPRVPIADARDYASRLRTLQSIAFTLRWEWRRSKFPNVRRRETATGSQVVTIAGDQFRADSVIHWRSDATAGHLADIAEGRQPV